MHRNLIRRFLPHHDSIRGHRHLSWLGTHLHDPNLWHLNRRSVSGAFATGLFCAFLPIPFQMVVAGVISILVRVNLPVSVVLVWVTNPLTMGPIFFFAYMVGTWLIGAPEPLIATDANLVDWLMAEFKSIWKPFLLGCFVCGSVSALLGYGSIRASWRLHLIRRINSRRSARDSVQP